MWITLPAWAEKNFDPPPCKATILKWDGLKLIDPPLIKVRGWMADENARFVGEQAANIPPASVSRRVADIYGAA